MAYAGFDEWEDGQEGGEGDKGADESFIAEFILWSNSFYFCLNTSVTCYKTKANLVKEDRK